MNEAGFIYNGPAQRRWRSGVFRFFASMDPRDFRRGLINDPALRAQFGDQVRKLHNVIITAHTLGVSITVAPGLEDNLNGRAFKAAQQLIKSAWPQGIPFKWVRSPCLRCSAGNSAQLSDKVGLEIHTAEASFENKGGVISNDGEHTRFSFESKDDRFIPLQRLEKSISKADQLRSTYLLWIAKYQDSPYGFTPVSPNTRRYKAPTDREKAEIISLLTQSAKS